jgi:signal transduction histidine kinase
MKVFGEELGAIGRWHIALPPLLLIGFLVGLFVLAAAGQSRLNAASSEVYQSQLRLQALGEFAALVTDAETGQRGYLLTGNDAYLEPYRAATPKIDSALDRLRDSYVQSEQGTAKVRELRILTGKKLGELEDAIVTSQKAGSAPALNIVRTNVGKRFMDEILAIVTAMRDQEAVAFAAATAQQRSDLRRSVWVSSLGLALNIGLVLLAARVVYGEMRRRARQASDLRDQKQELERLVEERTRELVSLSTHLQGVSEQEKSALSRELHDELGGLLVAARMDLSWLQQRLPTTDPGVEQRFRRIHESLNAGIDLKRRVVEDLRPTLLDNMGLFAALRWQLRETCRRKGLRSSESIPEKEMPFTPEAAIGVFRIVQEALTNILKHADAKSAHLSVEIEGNMFRLVISDDGVGLPAERLRTIASHGLASMRHRVSALGGSWKVHSPSAGGTVVSASIPLSKMLAISASTAANDR